MHIQGTRIAASRFRRHLTRTGEPEAHDLFETTAARITRGHGRKRLEHLHDDFKLEQRFARGDAE